MACYHPIPAAQEAAGGAIVLHPRLGTASLSLPCGRCVGCLSARASEWARRCTHEAGFYEDNLFVTLTYSDEFLPRHGGLVPEHFQLFLKRLRKAAIYRAAIRSDGSGVRFFGCGEYGERSGRPHYHALLFNLAFADRHRVGKDLYSSDTLADLWKYGDAKFGDVTGASAGYVAKYNVKAFGKNYVNEDGEVLQKPFLRMSRRPGIGARWLERYSEDLRNGFCLSGGTEGRVPRAYMRRLAKDKPLLAEQVSYMAYKHSAASSAESSDPARLAAGEVIALSRARVRPL